MRNFVAFEEDPHSDTLIKILAGHHQFHAVQQAVEATIKATSPAGDHRCGVVWHTQGSGKSLSMLFYASEVKTREAHHHCLSTLFAPERDKLIETGISAW